VAGINEMAHSMSPVPHGSGQIAPPHRDTLHASLPVSQLAAHTILIVDDSIDILDMYAVGLSYAGYRAVTATSAEAAVRTLKVDPVAAVVTDLHLRGTDGWALIADLKADPLTRSIPIVVLTGWPDTSVAAMAHAVGCAAVLTKPCLPEELADVLRRLLSATIAAA
jgi:CheY-like chemotaxis protein